MRAILIDTFDCEIWEIEHNGDYHQIYEFIGNGCRTFEAPVGFHNGDVLYVDEEGLYNKPLVWFTITRYPQPIAGRGLIVGTGRSGQTVAAKTPLVDIQRKVKFVELIHVVGIGSGWIPRTKDTRDRTKDH